MTTATATATTFGTGLGLGSLTVIQGGGVNANADLVTTRRKPTNNTTGVATIFVSYSLA